MTRQCRHSACPGRVTRGRVWTCRCGAKAVGVARRDFRDEEFLIWEWSYAGAPE